MNTHEDAAAAPRGARKAKFFISYAAHDVEWAEWIVWVLEANNNRVIFQKRDFRDGNIIFNIGRALNEAEKTVVVWSSAYGQTAFLQSEWQAALQKDFSKTTDNLIVLRIEDCKLPAILDLYVRTDLFGLSEEEAARKLTERVKGNFRLAARLSSKNRPVREKLQFPGELIPSFPDAARAGLTERIETYDTPVIKKARTKAESERQEAQGEGQHAAPQAFISYSHIDKMAADAACVTLEAADIRCWIAPRDIAPGAEWGEAIVEAIDHSSVMVLVFSFDANESPQVRREVQRAVSKDITIVPVRIQRSEATRSLAYFLAGVQWLDAFTPPLEDHLQRLAKSVKTFLKTAPGNAGRR